MVQSIRLSLATCAVARLVLAGFAAFAALASAYGLSLGLRHFAAKASHQQPTPEAWFENSPPSSPAIISQGRTLFLAKCAHCHGADATGDEGPDLHDVGVGDRYIARIIALGIKREMPSFRKSLGAKEIVSLTAYIRSLDHPAEGLPPSAGS